MGEPFLIWWTNQSDCERVSLLTLAWPKYLVDEFRSREGRAGRGRLWVPEKIENDPTIPSEAEFGSDNPVCRMAADAGGIVIRTSDYDAVSGLPGFITTFAMQLVRKDPTNV